MGDSFVEGDILSSDLREKLQLRFGGSGAGFAPMASPLTGFRRTIKTQSKGWDSYNIMQRRNTPAAISDYYYISGWLCQPSDGASVRWEGSSDRACLDSCRTARILFVSRDDSRIEVTVNDRDNRTFDIEGSPAVRQIVVHDDIRSLSFKVLSGAAETIGYGAIFESAPGVVVDNYSIRSNNGQAMFWTSPTVNAQINEMLGCEPSVSLVVLLVFVCVFPHPVNARTVTNIALKIILFFFIFISSYAFFSLICIQGVIFSKITLITLSIRIPTIPITIMQTITLSDRMRLRASFIRYPIPEVAAISSEATTAIQETPNPNLSPTSICGNACGKNTFVNVCHLPNL